MAHFDVTAAGFDGSTDSTDDLVYWVEAPDPSHLEALGAKFTLLDFAPAKTEIDYRLPADAARLGLRLRASRLVKARWKKHRQAEMDALVLVLQSLAEQGWRTLWVNDGEEVVKFPELNATLDRVADLASGTDQALLLLQLDERRKGSISLIWGNSPIELIADHSCASGFEEAVDAALKTVWPNWPEE